MMQPKHVRVYAPATIANVGVGFDVLGIALEQPGDIVIAQRIPEPGLKFRLDAPMTPVPGDNTNVAAHVAALMLSELNVPYGVAMTLQKSMPIGSGLGSSGASCAAAVMAINELLDNPLDRKDLIRFAVEGERLASGFPHADNVAPSILGGACLIRSYKPLDVIQLPIQHPFYWVAVHPHLIVHTKTARDLLPKTITLQQATEQWGNLGALVTGLITGNANILSRSFCDMIAEPVRAPLIPGFYEAKEAALNAGAIGFSISGSGPSVFAVTESKVAADVIGHAIQRAFRQAANVDSDVYVSETNMQGARVLELII